MRGNGKVVAKVGVLKMVLFDLRQQFLEAIFSQLDRKILQRASPCIAANNVTFFSSKDMPFLRT